MKKQITISLNADTAAKVYEEPGLMKVINGRIFIEMFDDKGSLLFIAKTDIPNNSLLNYRLIEQELIINES